MGSSDRPRFTCSTVRQAEDYFLDAVEKWRAARGIDKVVLVGHSFGEHTAFPTLSSMMCVVCLLCVVFCLLCVLRLAVVTAGDVASAPIEMALSDCLAWIRRWLSSCRIRAAVPGSSPECRVAVAGRHPFSQCQPRHHSSCSKKANSKTIAAMTTV